MKTGNRGYLIAGVIILTINIFSSSLVYSAIRTATASSKWETASTWSGGIVPTCGDSIVIPSGVAVQVTTILDYSTCASPMFLSISGSLTFQTGKKLKLPCNSKVVIASTGMINAGSGGGSSNLIDICNATVWNAAQGNLFGPATLQYNPLPIQLLHFSALPERDGVVLSWMTVSELNNEFFIVEKGKDGIHFEELGRMKGAGNSTKINSYELTDKNPFEGIQYYRLRQMDYDGKSTLSGIVGITWNTYAEFQIYPNPTRGELFANVDPKLLGEKGILYVNNANGKLVISKEIRLSQSTYGVQLLGLKELLKPGNYLVTLSVQDKSFTQFVVSK